MPQPYFFTIGKKKKKKKKKEKRKKKREKQCGDKTKQKEASSELSPGGLIPDGTRGSDGDPRDNSIAVLKSENLCAHRCSFPFYLLQTNKRKKAKYSGSLMWWGRKKHINVILGIRSEYKNDLNEIL